MIRDLGDTLYQLSDFSNGQEPSTDRGNQWWRRELRKNVLGGVCISTDGIRAVFQEAGAREVNREAVCILGYVDRRDSAAFGNSDSKFDPSRRLITSYRHSWIVSSGRETSAIGHLLGHRELVRRSVFTGTGRTGVTPPDDFEGISSRERIPPTKMSRHGFQFMTVCSLLFGKSLTSKHDSQVGSIRSGESKSRHYAIDRGSAVSRSENRGYRDVEHTTQGKFYPVAR